MTDPKAPQERNPEPVKPLSLEKRDERGGGLKPSKPLTATGMTLPNGDPPSWMLWGADE